MPHVPPGGLPGARDDVPPAPDGSDRRVGDLREPDPAPVRGPAAGVPDLSELWLFGRLSGGPRLGAADQRRPSDDVAFQHASEARFARLLDFYGLAWEYEPDAFPIEWDEDGSPTAWFRPDFYLPAFDLYIEITTSQQRLVTKKNRKLRLLREHHPAVRCKLFYQRDYLALVRRFGFDDHDGEDEPD
ncbi:MAG: hypothetical protein KY462_09555 [Actinobacteria bacterium]|nr:hypothetical protein [Actinomycetota bacterium]